MTDTGDDRQSSLFEWGEAERPAREELDARPTRGSLDLSQLPEALRDCRPEAHRLHVRLEERIGIVDLILTDNRRRMMSARRRKNRREVRLHHMFAGCPDEVAAAIADVASGGDDGHDTMRTYIQQNRDAISYEVDEDELTPRGEHFDLEAVLAEVQTFLRYPLFEFTDIHITWGRRGRGDRSIRFGSFDFDRKLIRVHPALDREWVPRYFVQFIVYHELLHAVCPPEEDSGRRKIHTSEFRELERQFPKYEEAMQWEAANLRRILDEK